MLLALWRRTPKKLVAADWNLHVHYPLWQRRPLEDPTMRNPISTFAPVRIRI
jgi:hypothetical protein